MQKPLLSLLLIFTLTNGAITVKEISKVFTTDLSFLSDFLLWNDIKEAIKMNEKIKFELHQKSKLTNNACNQSLPLIGATRWFWAAQLERIFSSYKVLNLDQNSSSFYTWRDNLADYANCPIIIFARNSVSSEIEKRTPLS